MPDLFVHPEVTEALNRRGYELIGHIGSGSYFDVWKASYKNSEGQTEFRAVRISKQEYDPNKAEYKEFLRKPGHDSRCRHPYVMEVFEYLVLPEQNVVKQYMVTTCEFCDCTLWSKLASASEDQIYRYLSQVADVLDHWKRNNFRHRDIKLANILIVERDDSVRIGDLGFLSDGPFRTRVATAGVTAPNQLDREGAHRSDDLYAFANCYATLRLREPVFEGRNDEEVQRLQYDLTYLRRRLQSSKKFYQSEVELLLKALHPDGPGRFSGNCSELLAQLRQTREAATIHRLEPLVWSAPAAAPARDMPPSPTDSLKEQVVKSLLEYQIGLSGDNQLAALGSGRRMLAAIVLAKHLAYELMNLVQGVHVEVTDFCDVVKDWQRYGSRTRSPAENDSAESPETSDGSVLIVMKRLSRTFAAHSQLRYALHELTDWLDYRQVAGPIFSDLEEWIGWLHKNIYDLDDAEIHAVLAHCGLLFERYPTWRNSTREFYRRHCDMLASRQEPKSRWRRLIDGIRSVFRDE